MDPVEDIGTHNRLNLIDVKVGRITDRLNGVNNRLNGVNSRLDGLHSDLVAHQQQLDQQTVLLSMQLVRLDALSDSLALRSTSAISAAGTQVPVVARFEYSSGDLIISTLLAILILIELSRILVGSVRGVRV